MFRGTPVNAYYISGNARKITCVPNTHTNVLLFGGRTGLSIINGTPMQMQSVFNVAQLINKKVCISHTVGNCAALAICMQVPIHF